MPKQSRALLSLTPATLGALETLGSHLALARMRRKESLATRAVRIGVSVPTLMKMERGDPTVSLGAYAQALWLIGRDGELTRIAAPEFDREAIERDVDQAIALGRQRSRASRAGRGAAPAPTARKAAPRKPRSGPPKIFR